jgi:hypothetical protein
MPTFDDFVVDPAPEVRSKSVVRLSTSYWITNGSLRRTQSITVMRRQSVGYQPIEEDASNIGVNEVFSKIVNLDGLVDGLYEVILCDESHDWETGYLDDYNYKLVPV